MKNQHYNENLAKIKWQHCPKAYLPLWEVFLHLRSWGLPEYEDLQTKGREEFRALVASGLDAIYKHINMCQSRIVNAKLGSSVEDNWLKPVYISDFDPVTGLTPAKRKVAGKMLEEMHQRMQAWVDDYEEVMRIREKFSEDAARFAGKALTEKEGNDAIDYWRYYPWYAMNHGGPGGGARTELFEVFQAATRVLMLEAEKQKLNGYALYECSFLIEKLYDKDPSEYGDYQWADDSCWPECMGWERSMLPPEQLAVLRAGEEVFLGLVTKLKINPDLPEQGKPGQGMSVEEANDRFAELKARHPAKVLKNNIMENAQLVGCSKETLRKTKTWEKHMERKKARNKIIRDTQRKEFQEEHMGFE